MPENDGRENEPAATQAQEIAKDRPLDRDREAAGEQGKEGEPAAEQAEDDTGRP